MHVDGGAQPAIFASEGYHLSKIVRADLNPKDPALPYEHHPFFMQTVSPADAGMFAVHET